MGDKIMETDFAASQSWREVVRAGKPLKMPDWDFLAALAQARALVAEFNQTPQMEQGRRAELLAKLFGRIGEGSWVAANLTVDVGCNIAIGAHCIINSNCTLLDTYPITLGDTVLLGPGVMLLAAAHPVRAAEREIRDPDSGELVGMVTIGAPIVIGDSAWLGAGAIVLAGVTIGARTVIGAGSVVTKSVRPDVVAAGNPCRVIRSL